MKKILVPTLIASAIASLAAVPSLAQAQESTLSYNVGVVSDYRYRGISQSRLEPAVQGGIDYADKSGFYVGAWGSTIKWIKDSGATKGNVEVDLYGGYKGTAGGLAYDVGFLRYEYVNNTLGKVTDFANANTNEVYGALTYGVFTAKYSHAISNLFGNPNTKNSYYLDLNATFDLGNGLTLVPHVGYQKFKNRDDLTYTDYSLTLAKDLGKGVAVSLAVVGTDANKTPYTLANKFNGKTGAVVGLKYTF
ncbi:MAG: TorF family putative porin [Limnohabitans sp.]